MTTSSAASAPTMRPALPRTSSAASGLRFCGMIEEPVENASDRRTKPNWAEVHSTISSAKRDRCTAQMEAAASVSSKKSRSETESSELAVGELAVEGVDGVAHPQPHVCGDLVVARAGGVQPPGRRADEVLQA